MVLIGAGTALAVTQRTSIILSAVPAQQTGAASGINTTSGKLGSVLGTAIMTTMFLRLLRSDYVDRMNPSGLSGEQLRQFTQEWRRAVRDNASVNSLIVPPELVRGMESAFKEAFSAVSGRRNYWRRFCSFLARQWCGWACGTCPRVPRTTPDESSISGLPQIRDAGATDAQRPHARSISAVTLLSVALLQTLSWRKAGSSRNPAPRKSSGLSWTSLSD